MRTIKRRDTGLERTIRSALHAQGLRFRVDYLVALPDVRAVRVDVAFRAKTKALNLNPPIHPHSRRIAAGDRVNGENRRLEGVSSGGEPQ